MSDGIICSLGKPGCRVIEAPLAAETGLDLTGNATAPLQLSCARFSSPIVQLLLVININQEVEEKNVTHKPFASRYLMQSNVHEHTLPNDRVTSI
jgi:hypothetical protein